MKKKILETKKGLDCWLFFEPFEKWRFRYTKSEEPCSGFKVWQIQIGPILLDFSL